MLYSRCYYHLIESVPCLDDSRRIYRCQDLYIISIHEISCSSYKYVMAKILEVVSRSVNTAAVDNQIFSITVYSFGHESECPQWLDERSRVSKSCAK